MSGVPRKSPPWKWLVPGGCLLFVVIFAACLVAPFYGIHSTTTSSDYYQQALQEMNDSQEVRDLVGDSIEHSPGWRVDGSWTPVTADVTFPVAGSRGSGSARVIARLDQDVWTIETLTVDVEGHGALTVIPRPAPAGPETTP